MEQIHRRLTDEQIRLIFRNYCDRQLTREEVQETLGTLNLNPCTKNKQIRQQQRSQEREQG